MSLKPIRVALAIYAVIAATAFACASEITYVPIYPDAGDDATSGSSGSSGGDDDDASGLADVIAPDGSGYVPDLGPQSAAFQINAVHRANFERVTGHGWEHVYSPWFNTAYAKHLYDTQGWGPWSCRYVL